MRGAGIYKDLIEDGGRWELKQALRWAITGQAYKDDEWLQTKLSLEVLVSEVVRLIKLLALC